MSETVITGLEQIVSDPPPGLKGKRLALLANPASVDRHFTHASRLIDQSFKGCLFALFSPQHGFYAEKQDNMIESDHLKEPELGIPVFSLYSDTRIPTDEMFDLFDILLVDIQDVGTRVYTFIYTVSYCLETAAKLGKSVIILDRPNPIGGIQVEGSLLEKAYASFVGRFPIPMRHGMTIGEICRYFNEEFNIGCDLRVIPMKNWRRQMYFKDTRLPWVMPSPNVPSPDTCMVYPGQVILEGTNISEGRGTTLPFEIFGAPFLNTAAIKKAVAHKIPGAHLRPLQFMPTSGKYKEIPCKGFQIHVTRPEDFKPYYTSLLLLQQIFRFHPEQSRFKEPPYEYEYDRLPIDLILGSRQLRERIFALEDIDHLESEWQTQLEHFKAVSQRYYLYE